MYLPSMSNKELLNVADHQIDDRTSTDMERELIKRLDAFLQAEADDAPLHAALDEAGIDYESLPEIIKALGDHAICDADELKAKLIRADKFYDIANESGDLFNRLTSLINETL